MNRVSLSSLYSNRPCWVHCKSSLVEMDISMVQVPARRILIHTRQRQQRYYKIKTILHSISSITFLSILSLQLGIAQSKCFPSSHISCLWQSSANGSWPSLPPYRYPPTSKSGIWHQYSTTLINTPCQMPATSQHTTPTSSNTTTPSTCSRAACTSPTTRQPT